MLQLLSATAVLAGTFGNWVTVDIGETPLYKIFSTYSSGILYVYDDVNVQNGYLDLYTLPVVARTSPMTLNAYLKLAAGLTITVEAAAPARDNNYVAFYFASSFGYVVKGFNNAYHPDTDLLPDQRIDLLLYNPTVTDYTRLQKNALFTVNGLIHRSDISDAGVVLYQGGRTITRTNDNRVGILDFSNLGEVTTVPITDDMIKAASDSISLSDVIYFDLPSLLEGKTVFLVLGGVLFAINQVFDIVGSSRVKVNLSRLPLIDQFYKTYTTLDLSDLPLTVDENVPTQFVVEEFDADAYVKAYFQLSQSFFVVLDTTGVTVSEKKLNFTDREGIYRSFEDVIPDLPVRVGDFLGAYNVKKHDGFWTLSVPNSVKNYPMKNRTTTSDEIGLNLGLVRDQNESYYPHYFANAELLLIIKE